MNFQTLFNVGDTVWLMKNNKPAEVEISAIQVFFVNTNQDRITYNAHNREPPSVSWLDNVDLPERVLYTSKQALLESL